MLSQMIPSLAVMGGLSFIAATGLTLAAQAFKVEENPLIDVIHEMLPNANCGGCGFPGCREFATALVNTRDPNLFCPVGGRELMKRIAEVLGMEIVEQERKVARVKCRGTINNMAKRYAKYVGIQSCKVANSFYIGLNSCQYACLGLGDCAKACPSNAISIIDGVAWVDEDKCTGCGICVKVCPRGVIELVPVSTRYFVACSNTDKGQEVAPICKVGCIGCSLCVRTCKEHFNGEKTAITVESNLAKINPAECDNCGACLEKCPRNAIVNLDRLKSELSSKEVGAEVVTG